MATYVTSDAHGHLRALDRALELAQPSAEDRIVVLGDMVDRGPDPVGVLELVRSLPGAHVLLGNHERMLLDTIAADNETDTLMWHMNGGYTTAEGLDALPQERYIDLVEWIAGLPAYHVVSVPDLRLSAPVGAERAYVLCHAGIDAPRLRARLGSAGVEPDAAGGFGQASVGALASAMANQSLEDLLWIREPFWSAPTGLVGLDGAGPIVVAGHTPSILLGGYAEMMSGTGADEELRGVMVEVGACRDTGGVADRIDIDCSAAAGAPSGRVGIMRLEDRRVWLADVEEGE